METDRKKLLEMKNINKRFGAVAALNNVDFELCEGEVLGLLGDNGAGKSTLIKIISGAVKEDSGEVYFERKKVNIQSPKDAIDLGIETIYQDLALFDNLDFTTNIFAGREHVQRGLGKIFGFVDTKKMRNEANQFINKIGIGMGDLNATVEKFSGGQRQAVAISRASFWGKKLLIMDEPTAALGVRESKKVLEMIKAFKEQVKGIIVIAHNFEHIINVADRAIVLRHGERVGCINFSDYKDKYQELHNDIVKMVT